jgi:hypothetical protein
MPQPLQYRTGEEIQKGDRVLFNSRPAEIELVAIDPEDPEEGPFVKDYGGGVMITDPHGLGRVFARALDEDLVFVARE